MKSRKVFSKTEWNKILPVKLEIRKELKNENFSWRLKRREFKLRFVKKN